MKGVVVNGGGGGRGSAAVVEKPRSTSDKEKTKLRERQRRSITTKIFNGLRKHGNYNLHPRADINDVLRALAKEAGWVVEPDGTTYRSNSKSINNNNKVRHTSSPPPDNGTPQLQQCPTCIAVGSCSRGVSMIGSGGDCSTNASPGHVSLSQPSDSSGERFFYTPWWAPAASSWDLTYDGGPTVYVGGSDVAAEAQLVGRAGIGGSHAGLPHQQLAFFQEARASNQDTHTASPQRRYG